MADIDVEKTDTLVKLFETAADARDAVWFQAFYEAVPQAAFHVAEGEEIFTGPDGFPYLKLTVPPAEKEFRGFSIEALLDQALEQGVGAAIFPETGDQPVWVFNYGNLLSYKLTGKFDAREPAPMKLQTAEDLTPTAPRQVMITQPNEAYLPAAARKILKKYLQLNGVGMPALFMLHDTTLTPPQQLVFNLFRENYENDEHFKQVAYRITWYLPPHYSFVTVPKGHADFANAFAAM